MIRYNGVWYYRGRAYQTFREALAAAWREKGGAEDA